MEAKDTFGDGGGRNYANSQFSNSNNQNAISRLCRITREARGESTDVLAPETHGHINSAGCEGMAPTVTAAHLSIWRHLCDSMHAAQRPKSKLKLVTLDKESNMSTLWRRKEFLRISHAIYTLWRRNIYAVATKRVSKNLARCGDEKSF